jgi:integrase
MRFITHDDVATLVAAYGGLRVGELIALKRRHVDLLHGTVTVVEQVQVVDGRFAVQTPKSAAGRRAVPLPALVIEALEMHLGSTITPDPTASSSRGPKAATSGSRTSAVGFGSYRCASPAWRRFGSTISATRAHP